MISSSRNLESESAQNLIECSSTQEQVKMSNHCLIRVIITGLEPPREIEGELQIDQLIKLIKGGITGFVQQEFSLEAEEVFFDESLNHEESSQMELLVFFLFRGNIPPYVNQKMLFYIGSISLALTMLEFQSQAQDAKKSADFVSQYPHARKFEREEEEIDSCIDDDFLPPFEKLNDDGEAPIPMPSFSKDALEGLKTAWKVGYDLEVLFRKDISSALEMLKRLNVLNDTKSKVHDEALMYYQECIKLLKRDNERLDREIEKTENLLDDMKEATMLYEKHFGPK